MTSSIFNRSLPRQPAGLVSTVWWRLRRLTHGHPATLACAAALLAFGLPARLAAQSIWVYPDGNALTKPIKTTSSTSFGLVNLVSGQTYYREILCEGRVFDCNSPTPEQFTAPLTSITVNYTTTSSGTGRIRLKVYEYWGGPADTGWYNVTVEALAAGIDATNNDNQDLDLCASSCFGVTYAQSTVPYFSLDAPRQITLVYNADRVILQPFVHTDVAPATDAPIPTEYWLEGKVSSDSLAFLNENGGKKIRFAASSQRVRLGGQFSASYATGVYPMDLFLTARYSDGSTDKTTFNTRLLTVNERQSKIARGWSIGGLQQIYPQGDGSLLVSEGGGSALYFAYSAGCTCYTSPNGDFSKVTSTGSGYQRAYPDSTKATFNTSGQLTRIADRFGNATDFEYDGTGRLTKVYDPIRTYNGGANRSYIALTYGTYGLAQIQEPGPDGSPTGGRITYITVASDSTLRVFKDPDGDSTRFTYDASRVLSTVIDRRGGVTSYNYASGKLASVDLPTVTLSDGSSASPRVSYSAWQTVSVPPGLTNVTPFAPTTTANVRGAATDALGRRMSFSSDHWGQPLTITEPLGRTTTITRTGIFPSNIQHHTGAIDYFSFVGPELRSHTFAGETQRNIRYGAWGQPDSVGGSGWPSMRRSLGPGGRVDWARIGPADSLRVTYTYDTRGRIQTETDSLGHTTRFYYDPVFGNLDSTVAPGGRYTKVVFDGYGRIQTQRANSEPARQVTYDAINRITQVADGVNPSPTLYGYDKLYLTRVKDAKGQVFRFDVNALGWVTREYDPADTLARYDSYGYDANGNLRTWTNRRGQQLSFAYDSLDRPVAKSGTNTTSDSMAYSANGRTMVLWNAVSRDSIFFAANGEVDTVVTRIAGQRFRINYRRNSIGQLDSVGVTGGGITFAGRRYGWNRETGELDTVAVAGYVTRFVRNKDLLPRQTIWPSVTRTEQWTAIHRPGEQTFSVAAVDSILYRGYSFDSRFHIRDEIRKEAGNLRSRQHGYDGLRRLDQWSSTLYTPAACPWDADNGLVCPAAAQPAYTFDAVGNRTDLGGTYASGNRILTFRGYTFQHDLDGNVTEKYNASTGERKNFEWSAEGLLTRVLINGVERVRYDYNAQGQLVRRWTNGVLDRHFLWDQGHLLAELDANATQRLGEYAYLPGVDQPFAVMYGLTTVTAIQYHALDEIGNVIGMTGEGSVQAHTSYDDWGVPTRYGNPDNRLLFKGLMWEGNYAGLYYVRARWYDPELGRFLSEDPLSVEGGMNKYAFAGNNPVGNSDPSGTCFTPGCIGEAAIGGAIIGAVAKIFKNKRKNKPLLSGVGKAAFTGALLGGGAAAAIHYAPWLFGTPEVRNYLLSYVAGETQWLPRYWSDNLIELRKVCRPNGEAHFSEPSKVDVAWPSGKWVTAWATWSLVFNGWEEGNMFKVANAKGNVSFQLKGGGHLGGRVRGFIHCEGRPGNMFNHVGNFWDAGE